MKKGEKGRFGRRGYPVADRYVQPRSRDHYLVPGLVVALLLGAMLAINFAFGSRRLLTGGELSTAHASLAEGCESCHVAFDAVDDSKCASCHLGSEVESAAFGWAAHAVSRAGMATEAVVSSPGAVRCTTCHDEHRGRAALLDRPADSRCDSCHVAGPFESNHPEFRFRSEDAAGAEALRFTHARHAARILERMPGASTEATCAACHRPDATGSDFAPIAFDRDCSTCHLGGQTRVANLPVRAAGVPLLSIDESGLALHAGVEPIETIRARRGPGESWAERLPSETFRQVGNRVSKLAIEHRDPWVLHNLRQLRAVLYPSSPIAGLLDTGAEAATNDAYRAATERLREQAAELRQQPEPWVHGELDTIRDWLLNVEGRLDRRTEPLAADWLDPGAPNPLLSDAHRGELVDLAARLSAPCQQCHSIQEAAIAPVRADAVALHRTIFDHRPHRQQLGCSSCHAGVTAGLEAPAAGSLSAAAVALDDPPIRDLPGIDQCRACHTREQATLDCVSCHVYHPPVPAGSDGR